MTFPVSTAPAAAAAFQALIVTQIADNTVLIGADIDFSEPSLADDIVSIGNIEGVAELLAEVGGVHVAGSMQESYTVDAVISVFEGGDDATGVRTRAFTLKAAVDTAVRNNVTLSGSVNEALLSRWRFEPAAWEDEGLGEEAKLTLTVACWAVL